VQSEAGVGSTFVVELPKADAPPRPDRIDPSNAVDPGASPDDSIATVLCIEDNVSNLRLVEVILRSQRRAKLVSAQRASKGIELAKECRPNLILLDLNLPDMHGYDVLTILKEDALTSHIPVVVTSADATQYQIERMMAHGAAAYLTKPLDLPKFLQTFDEMIARSAHMLAA